MARNQSNSTTKLTLFVSGQERSALLVSPTGDAGAQRVILALHGSNQTGSTLRRFTERGLTSLAARHQAVVVYPNAYEKHWNDARVASDFSSRRAGIDDTSFLVQLLEELGRTHGIDPTLTLGVGYSNGGQMINRMAHEAPEFLAGITLISANQPIADNFAPGRDLYRPLPVLLIHGTKDPNSPYAGGNATILGFKPRGIVLSSPGTAAYWANRNGITSPPQRTHLARPTPTDPTSIDELDYADTTHPPVRLITVHAGGHVVPEDRQGPRLMGRTTRHIRVSTEIEKFQLSAPR